MAACKSNCHYQQILMHPGTPHLFFDRSERKAGNLYLPCQIVGFANMVWYLFSIISKIESNIYNVFNMGKNKKRNIEQTERSKAGRKHDVNETGEMKVDDLERNQETAATNTSSKQRGASAEEETPDGTEQDDTGTENESTTEENRSVAEIEEKLRIYFGDQLIHEFLLDLDVLENWLIEIDNNKK